MTDNDLAKEEILVWLRLTKATEEAFPGLFQRAEQELLRTKKTLLDFEASKNVALSVATNLITPQSSRTGTADGGTSAQDFVDKEQVAVLLAAAGASVNLRLTQQVFSFAPELASALVEPELLKNHFLQDDEGAPLPVEFLRRLPFPTFVIVPNVSNILSILVNSCLVPTAGGGEVQNLSLIVRATGEDGRVAQLNGALALYPGQTLRQCVHETVTKQHRAFGDRIDVEQDREVALRLFEFALPLILYLCADNREVEGDWAGPPAPTKTKRGPRLFPPERPSVARVGVRIGATLRKHAEVQDSNGEGLPTGMTMPPHMRRSHWHVFWAGPLSQPGARYRKLRFLPPVPVNMASGEAVLPVVHPVAP